MTHVLIRRYGTVIDISPDGQSPLDPMIVSILHPHLSYEHKTLLRGHDRFGPDGRQRSMDITIRRMYDIEHGRLVTGFGFIFKVNQVLQQHGITAHFIDVSPSKPEGTYDTDWDRVNRFIGQFYGGFRPRQEECLKLIEANHCGQIHATMGFGKTFMFEAIAHMYPKAKIDICIRPKDVAARIRRKLSRSLPDIGQVGGGRKHRGERITIYTAGSTHHAEHSGADILLADEIHQLMTDTTSKAMAESWRHTRNFGFTATPKRLDGAHAKLELFFGPQIFELLYPEAVELGLVVPIEVRWIPIRLPHNPAAGKSGTSKSRWGIWRNQDRNRLIAEDIRTNYPDPDTQVLILVDKVDHAVHLWQYLPEFSLCYGTMKDEQIERYKKNHYLPENFVPTTSDVRETMRKQFEAGTLKRVIATDVWATGVDFEGLQVLYRADARESETMDAQGPGRVSRISPGTGKEVGEVVDCFDAFDSGFKRKSQTRKSHYTALGWAQKDWPSGRRQISYDA